MVATSPIIAGCTSGLKSVDGATKRSSAFGGQDIGCCHEVSASSCEGIDEVFGFIIRRLAEQKQTKTIPKNQKLLSQMDVAKELTLMEPAWMHMGVSGLVEIKGEVGLDFQPQSSSPEMKASYAKRTIRGIGKENAAEWAVY